MYEELVRKSPSDVRRYGRVFAEAVEAMGGAPSNSIAFDELAEHFPEDRVPFLDRPDVDVASLTPLQRQWYEKGYVILPGLVPQADIDEYDALRSQLGLGKGFFDTFTPYVEHEIVRKISLSPQLHEAMTEILGQDMALHFILTAYHSTERGWHQDDYLNPDYVYSNYCAAWISLGDINPDAGPFEFIEGSHRWPCVRRHLVHQHMAEEFANRSNASEGTHWAAYAEVFVNDAYVNEIERREMPISQFIGRPGDVLIWHGKLVHRGSSPNDPSLDRPTMISHFSGATVRSDIGTDIRRFGEHGCHYWHFDPPARS